MNNWRQLALGIKSRGAQFGFQQVGISAPELSNQAEGRLINWLAQGYHGEMEYMERHGLRRSRPAELFQDTKSIIVARMDYFPPQGSNPQTILADSTRAYISRYALGRDYHKVIKARLEKLARWITAQIGAFRYRVFCDSAPVLEKPLAEQAGLGWIGKHTNLIARSSGSWFFLGAIYTELPLPADSPEYSHCGKCTRCINSCPTGAIIAPYVLDARCCISYLTIELRGSIPIELRPLIGNRIYGCDDCQLVCPWNRFAAPTPEPDFALYRGWDAPFLAPLLDWSEQDFLTQTQGMAIRRIGYDQFLRNVAVALGNTLSDPKPALRILVKHRNHPSTLAREHIHWALEKICNH